MVMAATADPVKLRRHRRIVWYVIFAFFFSSIALVSLGFEGVGPIAFWLIFLTLTYVLLLEYRIRRAEKEDIKLQPYWKILVGNLLFAGFVSWMCSVSIFTVFLSALIVIGALLPMAISAGKESRGLRHQRWTRFLIYAIAVSVGGMLDYQASKNEQKSYDSVIAAVEQYKAAEKRYPDKLEQLMPKYLAAVPRGRWGKFWYDTNNSDDAHLSYDPMPFMHKSYSFKSKMSRTWD